MTAAKRPAPRPGILDIAAYIPGRSRAVPGVRLHKLSSNETPLGPSPMATEAYRAAAGSLELYPDGAATALRNAIARPMASIPIASSAARGPTRSCILIANAYIGPGDEAIHTGARFLVYPIAIRLDGRHARVARRGTSPPTSMPSSRGSEEKRAWCSSPTPQPDRHLPAVPQVRRLHAALPQRCCLSSTRPMPSLRAPNDYESGIPSSPGPPKIFRRRIASHPGGAGDLGTGSSTIFSLSLPHRGKSRRSPSSCVESFLMVSASIPSRFGFGAASCAGCD